MRALFAALILCAATSSCAFMPAFARDDGRYANSAIKPWFDSLRNGRNVPCCDTSDGKRIEDIDWRPNEDGTFSVRLNGNWVTIDKSAVLTIPNKVGYAILWQFDGRITCFLPGSEY